MRKTPRFIVQKKTLRLLHSKPTYNYYWQWCNTAILVYSLPNGNYLHYYVRKRNSEISILPF